MSTAYSVVIAVHDGEHYIRRAIGTALQQTVPGEIIVVDDGSVDASASIAGSYGERVTVIRCHENVGVSRARNLGIEAATTDYVAFLDVDDEWHPDKLRQQLECWMHMPQLDAVFTDFYCVDPDGNKVGWGGGLREQLEALDLRLEPLDRNAFLLEGNVRDALIRKTSFIHTSSIVVRRSALIAAGCFNPDYRGAEDLDLWIRLAGRGRMAYCDSLLAIKEERPGSLGRQSVTMARDTARLYESLLAAGDIEDSSLRDHVHSFLHEQHASLGWLHCQNRRYQLAAMSYRDALRHRWKPRLQAALLLAKARAVFFRDSELQ